MLNRRHKNNRSQIGCTVQDKLMEPKEHTLNSPPLPPFRPLSSSFLPSPHLSFLFSMLSRKSEAHWLEKTEVPAKRELAYVPDRPKWDQADGPWGNLCQGTGRTRDEMTEMLFMIFKELWWWEGEGISNLKCSSIWMPQIIDWSLEQGNWAIF